jgi:hypothetical protein
MHSIPETNVRANICTMKLIPDADVPSPRPERITSALERWYASHPMVTKLWAIMAAAGDVPRAPDLTRVVLMLQPTVDGDEAEPVWIANGHRWGRELGECVGGKVQLELLQSSVADEIDEDGVVLALSWRDACAVAG